MRGRGWRGAASCGPSRSARRRSMSPHLVGEVTAERGRGILLVLLGILTPVPHWSLISRLLLWLTAAILTIRPLSPISPLSFSVTTTISARLTLNFDLAFSDNLYYEHKKHNVLKGARGYLNMSGHYLHWPSWKCYHDLNESS